MFSVYCESKPRELVLSDYSLYCGKNGVWRLFLLRWLSFIGLTHRHKILWLFLDLRWQLPILDTWYYCLKIYQWFITNLYSTGRIFNA